MEGCQMLRQHGTILVDGGKDAMLFPLWQLLDGSVQQRCLRGPLLMLRPGLDRQRWGLVDMQRRRLDMRMELRRARDTMLMRMSRGWVRAVLRKMLSMWLRW